MYILFQVIDYIFKLFIFKLTFLVANVTVNYIFTLRCVAVRSSFCIAICFGLVLVWCLAFLYLVVSLVLLGYYTFIKSNKPKLSKKCCTASWQLAVKTVETNGSSFILSEID